MKNNIIVFSLLAFGFHDFMVCSDEEIRKSCLKSSFENLKNRAEQVSPNSVVIRPQSPWSSRGSDKSLVASPDLGDYPYQIKPRHESCYDAELHSRINGRFSQASLAAIEQAQKQNKRAPIHYFFNDMKQAAAQEEERKINERIAELSPPARRLLFMAQELPFDELLSILLNVKK